MPWTAKDARSHTKRARTAYGQRLWAKVANSVLSKTGSEGKAIRIANAAVRDKKKK